MTDTQHEPLDIEPGAGEIIVDKPERDWDKEAGEMGWQPKDAWKGDPERWRDSKEFVRRGEEIFQYVKRDRDLERARRLRVEGEADGRIKRLEGQYITAMEAQKTQHEAALKAITDDQRRAVEEGNVGEYDALEKRREAMGSPPEAPKEGPTADPAVVEWAKGNPWFNSDPDMRALAIATAGRAAETGADVHAQTAAAEKEVRLRYPEKFEKPRAIVETGGQLPRKRQPKGVAQLPREAREAFDSFVRMNVYKKEDIGKYAEKYWEQDNA